MGFDQFNLDSRLFEGISNAGYTEPTPIQKAAIPAALKGQDIIGTAQTGTGKTAAFVLPILNKLLEGPHFKSRALIVTPTRELAEQIYDTICVLRAGTGIRCAAVYGGVGYGPQVEALRNGTEILIVCPGRFLDHIKKKNAKLGAIEILVLDEADRMLDMGFLPSIREILEKLPYDRQTLLFSATFPPEIEKLAKSNLRKPERIAVDTIRPAYTVKHALYPVPPHLKTALIKEILKQTATESVLIFTRTKHRAKSLASQITRMGLKVTSLHGNRTQAQRQGALNGFKEGKYQVMVATDIAARGIDVESISHVINFDIPDTVDAYIHRIGRTGRAERNGDAFTLVTPDDFYMIKQLEVAMGEKLNMESVNGFDYEAKPIGKKRGEHKTKLDRKVKTFFDETIVGHKDREKHGKKKYTIETEEPKTKKPNKKQKKKWEKRVKRKARAKEEGTSTQTKPNLKLKLKKRGSQKSRPKPVALKKSVALKA